jgi:hypothetical protein
VITIMQTDAARRTYRWVTFGIAFVVSLSVLVPAHALLRFIPLGAAIWLDIHRYRLGVPVLRWIGRVAWWVRTGASVAVGLSSTAVVARTAPVAWPGLSLRR